MRPIDLRKGKWATPDWLYHPLNELLRFDLDAAASPDNARCRKYFTREDNALERPWKARSVWCNPPYGQDPGTDVWVEHGRNWAQRLNNRVTMLVPVKAETAWYQDLVWGENRVQTSAKFRGVLPGRWYQLREDWGYVELLELRGRVAFEGQDGTGFFASSVVVFNAGRAPVLPELERLPASASARRASRGSAASSAESRAGT